MHAGKWTDFVVVVVVAKVRIWCLESEDEASLASEITRTSAILRAPKISARDRSSSDL